jgi:predicted nucleic acid-binding protein
MSGGPPIGLPPSDKGKAMLAAGSAPTAIAGAVSPKPYIIDTSVALKWYIPEAGSAEARRYMGPGIDRHAPDLLPLEGAHALLKRTRSADPALRLSIEDALIVAEALRDHAPIRYHPCGLLLGLSLTLALEIGASVYDGLFLALAIRQDGLVVTADGRFRDKILNSPHAARVRWFMDLP